MGLFSNEVSDDVIVSATFPDNPFGLIVNGEKNAINIHLQNVGSKNYKLVSAAASYHNPANHWALVKNATTLKYNVDLISGSNFSAPFTVNSEFRPQELGLTVWVNLAESPSSTIHTVTAYNSTVSITEPQAGIFDLQLIFLYLILGTALSGAAYWIYQSFVKPQPKRRGGVVIKEKKVVPVKVEGISADVKLYEEEWIPENQLRSRQKKNVGKRGGASSGGEGFTSGGEVTSGGETSGAEGKSPRRRGKKA